VSCGWARCGFGDCVFETAFLGPHVCAQIAFSCTTCNTRLRLDIALAKCRPSGCCFGRLSGFEVHLASWRAVLAQYCVMEVRVVSCSVWTKLRAAQAGTLWCHLVRNILVRWSCLHRGRISCRRMQV
jgi:hypothetical protein